MSRTRVAGFTLIELMIVVAIIGILAAIAIPNFIKFQARSKQAEAKGSLKSLFTAEKAYKQEKDFYTICTSKMGWEPERGNRYYYAVNAVDGNTLPELCTTAENRSSATGSNTASTDGAIQVDTFKYGSTFPNTYPVVAYAQVAPSGSGIQTAANLVGTSTPTVETNGTFGGAATGNIDSDTQLDLWYVSGVPSVTTGVCPTLAGIDSNVPGGEPKNTYNDVICP